jgi:hypothetical protein
MSQQWWYLRRAVPWAALLGCCAAAVVTGGLLERWPTAALVLMPVILVCCAAAAGFAFDEMSIAVVEVTPRGANWRRVARLSVTALPLALWSMVVWLRPGDLVLDREAWWAVGGAVIVLAAGCAATASRRCVASPGNAIAPLLAIALTSPLVLSGLLGWSSLYPFDDLTVGASTVWAVVGVAGIGTWLAALRPEPRR